FSFAFPFSWRTLPRTWFFVLRFMGDYSPLFRVKGSLHKFPLPSRSSTSLSGMKNEVGQGGRGGLTPRGGVATAGFVLSLGRGEMGGTTDRDRIREAVLDMQTLQLEFDPLIDGPVLGRTIGHDENLGTALLEDQLGRPRLGVLECRRVFMVEQVAQLGQAG